MSTTAQPTTIAPAVGVYHYVDLDTGEDVISVNGVCTTPRQVFGSGCNLWVWTQDGSVYHAADWGGDADITPLTKK